MSVIAHARICAALAEPLHMVLITYACNPTQSLNQRSPEVSHDWTTPDHPRRTTRCPVSRADWDALADEPVPCGITAILAEEGRFRRRAREARAARIQRAVLVDDLQPPELSERFGISQEAAVAWRSRTLRRAANGQ